MDRTPGTTFARYIKSMPNALRENCIHGNLLLARTHYNDLVSRSPASQKFLLYQMALVSAKNAHPDILSFCFSSGLKLGKDRIDALLIEAACYSSTIPPIAVLLDQGGVDINHCLGRLGNPLISATY